MHASEVNASNGGRNIQYAAFHPKAQLLVDLLAGLLTYSIVYRPSHSITEQWHEDVNNLKELTATGIVLASHQIPF